MAREIASCRIIPIEDQDQLSKVAALFRLYADDLRDDVGIDLMAFGFADEIATLPSPYTPPGGTLLLAIGNNHDALGCVGVKPLGDHHACEAKRLFVARHARGRGVGCALMSAAAGFAARRYASLCLDTLATLSAANRLYGRLGFHQCPPYWQNPVPGAIAFRKDFRDVPGRPDTSACRGDPDRR